MVGGNIGKGMMMEQEIRSFEAKKDYFMMCNWWKTHGSFAPKLEHLPASGIVVEIDGTPTACGFLYHTDSKICVFEFVVTNPMAEKEERNQALALLIDAAISWAEKGGYHLIYSSIGIPKYIARLEEKGFIQADLNQTHMFKEVNADG